GATLAVGSASVQSTQRKPWSLALSRCPGLPRAAAAGMKILVLTARNIEQQRKPMNSLNGKYKPRLAAGTIGVVTVLMVAEFVGTFESAMIFIALPSLMSEFNADAAAVGWAATAFLLVAAAS